MMQAAEENDDETFVYMGGDQQVPDRVRRAKIHKSVKIVRARAFKDRRQLIYVEFHDGIEFVEEEAFYCCQSLRGVKLLGVKIIKQAAFFCCVRMTDVEFGDKLETIEDEAFNCCHSLSKIRIPSVRTIGAYAFASCHELSDVQFGERLLALQEKTFVDCDNLKRIALPLKSGLIGVDAFKKCPKLRKVNLVGGVHNTVDSLHMESWRDVMMGEINRIDEELPTVFAWQKTVAIQQWMESTMHLLDECKTEHRRILKETTTLLELALWKANLDYSEGKQIDREGVRTTRGGRKRARKEICVTSGADVVIKNVLPFLQLVE